AFVLGAGLGTRLRLLTERRPKPLVPIFGKPLITFAFDHLIAGGITSFVVNTHHCPETYPLHLGGNSYRGLPIALRHEPVLLETGGGIKNVEDLIGNNPFVVYNGDVLADFPLQPVIDRHLSSGNLATLVLRSSGGPLHIQCRDGRITDIRNTLGNGGDPSFLFSGITVLSPEIFYHIPAGQIVSIIPIYLNLIRSGAKIGGEIVDAGLWFDLGTRNAYLDAHELLKPGGQTLSYLDQDWPVPIQAGSHVPASARIEGTCAIGAGSVIGEAAFLKDCVLWENSLVAPGSHLTRCVVRDGQAAAGTFLDTDF
ncbi:MAG: sugar phosphate nucleotidyltransferase, partial [Terrimicrobiaceae bacterium]